MTKLLKGLSARNVSTVSEDFITARHLAAFAPATVVVQPVAAFASDTFAAPASDELVFKQLPGVLEADESGTFTVLDCALLDTLQLTAPVRKSFVDLADKNSPEFVTPSDPSLIADEGPLVINPGGSATGVIDVDGDTDDVFASLVAGQTYLLSLRGTGPTPLTDTLLRVFNPAGTLVDVDDDGGNGTFSVITFTATATGTYRFSAESFNNGGADVGTWTMDLRQQGADLVGDTNATATPLSFGTTFGFRETGGAPGTEGTIAGDADRYSVTLQAGHFYTFSVAAGYDGALAGDPFNLPAGTFDTHLRLLNSGGTVVASNDDINFPTDANSSFGFFATVSGTYYLDVRGYSPNTGGYVLDAQDIDPATRDPLQAIRWVSADNIDTVAVGGVPTAYVYFGAAGQTFGETDDFSDPIVTFGWTAKEKAAVMEALLEFTKITGIQYLETTDINQAEFRLNTVDEGNFGAYFYPQDDGNYGPQQGIGIFNVNSGGWDKPGVSTQDVPGDQVSLDRGGYSFAVILHEFGHAHGLAHLHDNGGGSDILLGVTSSQGSLGIYNLNQGVYSVMSYNDAWQLHPDGPSPFTIAGIDNGWSATLSAFDIAVLQERYGVHAFNATDTVYALTDVVDDAFYQTIWDSGGTDVISYGGAQNATIDLLAATLDYSPTGGGVISFVNLPGASALRGGYTIAHNVVIENATGGSGDDTLIGNSAANVLSGNGGLDNLMGRAGNDTLNGGGGFDTAVYTGNRADYTVTEIIQGGNVVGYSQVVDNRGGSPDGTDTLNSIESIRFADQTISVTGNVLVFDQNGNLVNSFATIQEAVNASFDNYTVVVNAGTYTEQVVIDGLDNFTIQAVGGANVVIQSPADLVETVRSSTDGEVHAIVTVRNAQNVTIEGIDVNGLGLGNTVGEGAGAGAASFYGIYYRNSSGSVLFADVTGIRDPFTAGTTLSNVQRGIGVGVDNDTQMDFVMSGGSITGFQQAGAEIRGANLTLGGALGGVLITGGGSQANIVQNGVIVSQSTGTISGNTINGLGYTGGASFASGVLGQGNTNLNITSNTIAGSAAAANTYGISIVDATPDNSGGSINSNTISVVDRGISVTGDVAPNQIAIGTANTITPSTGGVGVYHVPTNTLSTVFNVNGSAAADTLSGAAGNDTLSGAGGADRLEGEGGNDNLLGGAAADTAVYNGNYADYTITTARNTAGFITSFTTVTDNVPAGGNDGADTLTAVEILEFADRTIDASGLVQLFDSNDVLIGSFGTIQAAVNAAANGQAIRIAAGTFAEDVKINKDITVIGNNVGIPGTASRLAETNIRTLEIISNGVAVHGVRVTGSFAHPNAPGFLGGVYVIGNDFVLQNSILSGPDTSYGILTQSVTGLNIGNNLITGYGAGAYFSGDSTGSFHDNRLQGNGPGSGTGMQNGVLTESSVLLIEDNTFTGIDGGAIFVLSDDPAVLNLNTFIVDNTITNSGAARPVQIFPNGVITTVIGTDFAEAFNGDSVAGGRAFTFEGRGGNDILIGAALSDTLNGGTGNDTLDGAGGIDRAIFADANLTYVDTPSGWLINSSEGNDLVQNLEIVIDGSGERNLLVGSTGFATLQAALNAAEAGDTVRLAANTYGGTVNYSDAGLTVIAQPGAQQSVTYVPSAGQGIAIYGAELADTITTGAGNDLLNGGLGNDTLTGGTGNDFYFVDSGDTVVEVAGQGSDRIFATGDYVLADTVSVETLSTADDTGTQGVHLTGNNQDNSIFGNAGDNFLRGEEGADLLAGRGGNDFYFVDNVGDTVLESLGQGADRLFSSVSYTLNDFAEVETLSTDDDSATSAIDLTGNAFSNNVYGNAGTNVVDGKGGSDTLFGRGGADTFAFTTALGADNVDTIGDFNAADDTIALDDAVFAGLSAGALNPNAFVTGTAAQDADDRIIYNQATGALFFDADGNGGGAAVQFATLSFAPIISASDFTVI